MDVIGQINALLSGHVSSRDMRKALDCIKAIKDDPEMRAYYVRKAQESALYTIAFSEDLEDAKQLAQLALEPTFGAFGSKS